MKKKPNRVRDNRRSSKVNSQDLVPKTIEARDDLDDVADGAETDDDEEDVDADEEFAADEDEDEGETSESDGDAKQADDHSPLKAMDQVIVLLGIVENVIHGVYHGVYLDDDSIDEFLLALQEAQDRLGQIQEAVECQKAGAERPGHP